MQEEEQEDQWQWVELRAVVEEEEHGAIEETLCVTGVSTETLSLRCVCLPNWHLLK